MAMKAKKIFFIAAALGLFLCVSQQGYAAKRGSLLIFHSPACHKCLAVRNEIMPQIEKQFKGSLDIKYLDISDMASYKILLDLRDKYRPDLKIVLPVFYLNGNLLNGADLTLATIRNFITQGLLRPAVRRQGAAAVNLSERFRLITPLVIVSAGLIDGINPCAFTVIVFFISFLALQGYRRRELVVIGLVFVLAVFLTYLLLGLGFFGFIYRLKGFWLVSRIINFCVGVFSIILGLFALHDFFKFKKSGRTEGLLLQLPQLIKNRIHAVVGMHYRNKGSDNLNPAKHSLAKLVVSALVTGFLVSLLEAVCTGQTYLPTIVFILKASHHLRALVYLVLYNLMFIAPLLAIFLFALLGVTSGQFSKFLKERLLLIKILMAVLFLGLGIFLLWRA